MKHPTVYKISSIILILALSFLSLSLHAQPPDAYLLNQMNIGKMPGASMALIKDGHWVYSRSLGKANIEKNVSVTKETDFIVSAVSTTIVATAIMQLWEKGALKLDDNVNNYLPFHITHPFYPADSITIRMLITNTASIHDNWSCYLPLFVNGDSPIPLGDFLANYFTSTGTYYNAPANFYTYKPGAQWDYSGVSFALAAYITERITGDKFSHYCDTAIFSKLCMTNTSYLLSGIDDTSTIARPYSWESGVYTDNGLYGFPNYPEDQLRTNITSLARFMTMYMQYGRYEASRILDSSTVVLMTTPQVTLIPLPQIVNQGLGFVSRVYHAGAISDTLWGMEGTIPGAQGAMYFCPNTKTGVIVMANGPGTSAGDYSAIFDTLYSYYHNYTPGINDTFPRCPQTITAVPVINNAAAISLFPNPVTTDFDITVPIDSKAVLTDITGSVKATYHLQKNNNHLQLPLSLQQGMYFVQVYSDGALPTTIKLVHLN